VPTEGEMAVINLLKNYGLEVYEREIKGKGVEKKEK
jgi:hypothetical protein